MTLSIAVSDNAAWTGHVDGLHSPDHRLAFELHHLFQVHSLSSKFAQTFMEPFSYKTWPLSCATDTELQNYMEHLHPVFYVNRNTEIIPYSCLIYDTLCVYSRVSTFQRNQKSILFHTLGEIFFQQ